MTKINHIILGGLTALALGYEPALAVLGSIFPDKDILLAKLFGTWSSNKKRKLLTAHRGFTHHAILIPTFLIFSLLLGKLWGAFFLGYTLHLICDLLTPLGIPYKLSYYPRLSFPLFKTNSILEYVFVGIISILLTFYIVEFQVYYEVIGVYKTAIEEVFSLLREKKAG